MTYWKIICTRIFDISINGRNSENPQEKIAVACTFVCFVCKAIPCTGWLMGEVVIRFHDKCSLLSKSTALQIERNVCVHPGHRTKPFHSCQHIFFEALGCGAWITASGASCPLHFGAGTIVDFFPRCECLHTVQRVNEARVLCWGSGGCRAVTVVGGRGCSYGLGVIGGFAKASI